MLEFTSRVRAQSITAVVEQSLREASAQTGIGPRRDDYGNQILQKTWSDFWDPSDEVKTLKLIADPDYPTTFDEDEMRQFTLSHWQFFYSSFNGTEPRRVYVDILWPNIHDYMKTWKDTRLSDYRACGKVMLKAIVATKISPPTSWPLTDPAKPSKPIADDLDDDIEF